MNATINITADVRQKRCREARVRALARAREFNPSTKLESSSPRQSFRIPVSTELQSSSPRQSSRVQARAREIEPSTKLENSSPRQSFRIQVSTELENSNPRQRSRVQPSTELESSSAHKAREFKPELQDSSRNRVREFKCPTCGHLIPTVDHMRCMPISLVFLAFLTHQEISTILERTTINGAGATSTF